MGYTNSPPAVEISGGTITIKGTPTEPLDVVVEGGTIDITSISGPVRITDATGPISVTDIGPTYVENVAGSILQVGDCVDVIATGTFTSVTTITEFLPALTKSYSMLSIVIQQTSTKSLPYWAQVYTTGSLLTHPVLSGAFSVGTKSGGNRYDQAFCMYADQIGQVGFFQAHLVTASSGRWYVLGWTDLGVPIRPDGRTRPPGARRMESTATTAVTTTMVAAPSSTGRIIVKYAALSITPAAGTVEIFGMVNGGTVALLRTRGGVIGSLLSGSAWGSTGLSQKFSDGILLDPATALSMKASGAGGHTATVLYDIIK